MNSTSEWYKSLNKPFWAPQEWVFGAVWSVLYPIIIAVNVYVVILLVKGKIGWLIALPFWLNIVFNALFTPIQFGLRNNWLAVIDIFLVLATTIWAIIAIYNYNKLLAYAFVPYAIWVFIATLLQTYIAVKN
jgi:tryptophan-rich sensory protein